MIQKYTQGYTPIHNTFVDYSDWKSGRTPLRRRLCLDFLKGRLLFLFPSWGVCTLEKIPATDRERLSSSSAWERGEEKIVLSFSFAEGEGGERNKGERRKTRREVCLRSIGKERKKGEKERKYIFFDFALSLPFLFLFSVHAHAGGGSMMNGLRRSHELGACFSPFSPLFSTSQSKKKTSVNFLL